MKQMESRFVLEVQVCYKKRPGIIRLCGIIIGL